MVSNINSTNYLLNSMFSTSHSSNVNSTSQIYDYKAAQRETQAWMDSYKTNNATVQTLKADTAKFLDDYTKNINNTNSAAGKLTNGGIDELLYNKDGKVTEETVKATVDAMQGMVDEYNNTLSFLNKNADRGPGVENQIYRMSGDPAAKEGMEMVGVTVNADGTLALDTEKLTEALSTENSKQLDLYKDIIGGSNGIAAGVQRDARAGMNQSAAGLVRNDLAEMQSTLEEDPIRSYASSMRVSGAYGYSNMAAIGILMNMTA